MKSEPTPEWVEQLRDPWLLLVARNSFSGSGVKSHDGLVRDAFILLERRIRETAGLGDHEFGKDLIDKAFVYPHGILQPVSASPGECAGLYHLLLGIFLYYRNPVAHRELRYTDELTQSVLMQIDHALDLVAVAARSVVDLSDFLGPHEGQILRRHDYRVDIDNDGEKEIIVLLELGPSSIDGIISQRLATVIIDKVDGVYRRIAAENTGVASLYGPSVVRTVNITGQDVPDLLIHWTHGMSSSFATFLWKKGGEYVIARREVVQGVNESWMPSGDKGFLSHYRQEFRMADYDGDGMTEIIQELQFSKEETEQMGYSLGEIGDDSLPVICRTIKWDRQKELLVHIAENVVIQSSKLEGSLSFLKYIQQQDTGGSQGGDPSTHP